MPYCPVETDFRTSDWTVGLKTFVLILPCSSPATVIIIIIILLIFETGTHWVVLAILKFTM